MIHFGPDDTRTKCEFSSFHFSYHAGFHNGGTFLSLPSWSADFFSSLYSISNAN